MDLGDEFFLSPRLAGLVVFESGVLAVRRSELHGLQIVCDQLRTSTP